jgi:sugar phosphate isomerase/epimerase
MKIAMVVSIEPTLVHFGLSGDLEENIRLIANLGFDGVELHTGLEPRSIDTKNINEIVARYSIKVVGIVSTMYYLKHGLFLSASDREVREKAIEAVKEFLRVAGKLNGNILLGGTVQGRMGKSYEESFAYTRDSLKECAKTADELGVNLFVEPVNRYLGDILIKTIKEEMKMLDAVGSPRIKVVADACHMNIEEVSLTESIRQAKGYLGYFHAADSNRMAPGQGHVDFPAIIAVLKEIGYEGYLSAEIDPLPDQVTAAKLTIQYLKPLL